MPTAIEFNHVSKQYRLGLVSTKTLSHDLDRWWKMNILGKEDPYLKIGETNDRATKGESDYVWALKDIDFKVEQGDVVGIIGKNGAGKSTLLKLLSKVTGPTTGSIKARGRIGALLEVGTGFHQEMTGRENIFLNGAILGMSRQEIAKKLDEIVDFSGCERYIDTPVKRYSSGMMVRLGFAVAAHLDPEILVVDEVLAVGDAEFQKKAIGKMQDVSRGEGRTVLFVSHNMDSIKRLCKTGIILENGSIDFSGVAEEAIVRYINSNIGDSELPISERKDHAGDGRIKVKDALFLRSDGKETSRVFTGNPIDIKFLVDVAPDIDETKVMMEVSLCDDMDRPIVTWWTRERGFTFNGVRKKGEVTLHIPALMVRPGNYYLYFQFVEKSFDPSDWCDLMNHAKKLEVQNRNLLYVDQPLGTCQQGMVDGNFEI